ncbi:MAG: RsmD family RNA methyltransferase, partial [Candidatus Caldarchaeum sp.]|nr:RsmD family RNA methyltransferase [Candidatus Caldarchaeum sp.]
MTKVQRLFRPKRLRLMAGFEAARLTKIRKNVVEAEISLDLGLSKTFCQLTPEAVVAGTLTIGWEDLERAAEVHEDVYIVGRKMRMLSWFKGSYYKLVLPRWGHAPTVEINGIRMHRTEDVPPELDAAQKIQLVRSLRGRKVLDVCTGLGYTSIAAWRMGAARVVSVEKDPNVLRMASYNPWSREMFGNVEIVLDDAVDFLTSCGEVFDVAVHDPPTFKMAGELYSLEFYRLLAGVLRKGGELVHYVGQP